MVGIVRVQGQGVKFRCVSLVFFSFPAVFVFSEIKIAARSYKTDISKKCCEMNTFCVTHGLLACMI